MKIYRLTRADQLSPEAAFLRCLESYQPPVSPDTIEFQMRLAMAESTDISFIPEPFRKKQPPMMTV